MNWKKGMFLLLCPVLVWALLSGCGQQTDGAVEHVRSMAEALPSVEAFQAMGDAARQEAYLSTQRTYDAYQALEEEQQAQLKDVLEKITALFDHFNTQIMPIAE